MRTDILQQAQAIRASMDAAAIVLTDEQAAKAGDRLYYSGTDRLYKVVSDHTTQSDWTPDAVPALYTVIDVAHAGTQDDPHLGRAGHGVRLRLILHRQRGRQAVPVPAYRRGCGRSGGIAISAA